ncbi:hypothetical protein B0I08_11032 [Glaciihabitans tibetensis]|uniref:Restriction endonuclease n=1 Tax=Glaciihabitans tibetensis TaxID=1266600 RepID=A0A2T0V5F6_9MICO|nr:hypothetical protein [Glaciihabitans tibetensis]PRY65400.1 hypothetical protein B0I08_11032 [Glaciihabitans tibetensis]
MGYIDWTLLASDGASVEDFVATLLRRKFPNALQVNPSQGDKGIDVYMETKDGLVVWQVKKFTTPLVPSQWRQVEKSWRRFWNEKVSAGVPIASYTLVTPWTPTEERRSEFAVLTASASFPTQWDGDSFIVGLADEFPETLARFRAGSNALEQFVTQKSLLASSPVESGDSVTMMRAVSMRQANLNDLAELVSDNYHIDTGTITLADGAVPVFASASDAAVMHRYTSLGNNRFSYEAVVPRTSQSLDLEPLTLSVSFNVTPESPESKSVSEWSEWGIPFTDVPASVRQTGGPLQDDAEVESLLSFVAASTPRIFPEVRFQGLNAAGINGALLELTPTQVTKGITTNWVRVLAQSPSGLLGLEIRLGAESVNVTMRADKVRGMDPNGVLSELAQMDKIAALDSMALSIDGVGDVAKGGRFEVPEAMRFMGRVAECLSRLQASSNDTFVMPDGGVTMGQLRELEALADLYDGNARTDTWSSLSFVATSDNTDLVQLVESGHMMVEIVTPHLTLGDCEYVIHRPMVRSRKAMQFEQMPEGGFVEGETYRVIPLEDNTIVTAAVVDWTRGDPSLQQ